MKKYIYPSVLSIAGFDGSGGAGIQADIKTISALGCYATTVLTALPVQNTTGVKTIYPIPETAVREQLVCILDDIFPHAIKIGMVHSCELAYIIRETLDAYKKVPVIFDPVMVSTSGHKLIEDKTIQTIIETLFPITDLLTPNLDEAAVLSGMPITTLEDMYKAGEKIKALGVRSLLLKGGHLNSKRLTSLYFDQHNKITEFHQEKYNTTNTHGSGCTLSSAIATYIARRLPLNEAVHQAQLYIDNAILTGSDVMTGKGNGPLNHFFNPLPLLKYELES